MRFVCFFANQSAMLIQICLTDSSRNVKEHFATWQQHWHFIPFHSFYDQRCIMHWYFFPGLIFKKCETFAHCFVCLSSLFFHLAFAFSTALCSQQELVLHCLNNKKFNTSCGSFEEIKFNTELHEFYSNSSLQVMEHTVCNRHRE